MKRWRNLDKVEPPLKRVQRLPTRHELLGRTADPSSLMWRGNSGFIMSLTEFGLTEDKKRSPLRHDIYLATTTTPAMRQNAMPGNAQIDHRNEFGAPAKALRTLAVTHPVRSPRWLFPGQADKSGFEAGRLS